MYYLSEFQICITISMFNLKKKLMKEKELQRMPISALKKNFIELDENVQKGIIAGDDLSGDCLYAAVAAKKGW